jgi:hypothetical protein
MPTPITLQEYLSQLAVARRAMEERGAAVDTVKEMEVPTINLSRQGWDRGTRTVIALDGYEPLVRSFALLNDSLSADQARTLLGVADILGEIRTSFNELGYQRGKMPSDSRIDRYISDKLNHLQTSGQAFMQTGDATHATITRIKKLPDGNYTYTTYNAGDGAQIVGTRNGRDLVHVVEEFRIRADADLGDILEADIQRKRFAPESREFRQADRIIQIARSRRMAGNFSYCFVGKTHTRASVSGRHDFNIP